MQYEEKPRQRQISSEILDCRNRELTFTSLILDRFSSFCSRRQ